MPRIGGAGFVPLLAFETRVNEPSTPAAPDLSRLRISREAAAPARRGGRRAPWIAAIVVVLGGLVLWLVVLRPQPLAVETAAVTVEGGGGAVTGDGISANGYVVARTKASVSAKIPGRLAYLGVSEGSHVRAGQVIARIESDAYVAALAAAQANVRLQQAQLAQTRRDQARAEALQKQQVLSAADLESAETKTQLGEAAVASAEAQAQVAAADLENTRVRAPFDGTVLQKDAEVGEIVQPAAAGGGLARTAIVTMADLATLEVEVDVNEAYIAQIHNGQAARVTLDAYADTSFRAQVRQIVPTADRDKATVLVKVSILDRDPRILPEMGAKVVFLREAGATTAAAPTRVLVPADAIVRAGGGTRVWLVANGAVASRDVVIGRARGNQFEVQAGLTGGELVVVHPDAKLSNGRTVRPRAAT